MYSNALTNESITSIWYVQGYRTGTVYKENMSFVCFYKIKWKVQIIFYANHHHVSESERYFKRSECIKLVSECFEINYGMQLFPIICDLYTVIYNHLNDLVSLHCGSDFPGFWWSDPRPANGQLGQTHSPGTHEHLHTPSLALLADLDVFGIALLHRK